MIIAGTFKKRGASAPNYWQLNWRDCFSYFKTATLFCLIIFLPLSITILIVGQICLYFGCKFTQPIVEELIQLNTWKPAAAFLTGAVIIAPLWEELYFRGILYPVLKKFMPLGWAMFGSSLAWALIHWHWPVFLPFTFLGCALCLLYEQTGKIGNAIAAHMIFNTLNITLLLLEKYYGNT
ncbi:MAG: CPBP family intramembrane metalloprotease [Verrucomicrobiales bacterium]|nr:CPBP family intramembrane metalloprotease [Verrucomicrobiales bacterium]